MPERSAPTEDPFYVGYLERSPAPIATRTRVTVAMLLALGLGLGALLVSGQSPFDQGVFEFGVDSKFHGLLVERPYPLLLVPSTEGGDPVTHYLAAIGKIGAGKLVEGLDGQPVEVHGSLIYNNRQRMIEVHSVVRMTEGGAVLDRLQRGPALELGRLTLVGEIVDSKCHLGVMKPGRGKPHKACAIRCISGGIPPVLRVEDGAGNFDYLMLVTTDGQSVNQDVLDFVAEPVEISGRVVRRDNLLILYADPSSYRRLQR